MRPTLEHLPFLLAVAAAGCVAPYDPLPREQLDDVSASPDGQRNLEGELDERARSQAPVRQHRVLDAFLGRWEAVVTVGDTDQRAGFGHATVESVHGGLFLRWEMELQLAGRPVTSTRFLGYDLGSGEYQSISVSELASGMTLLRGKGDPFGRGLDLIGGSAEAAGLLRIRFVGEDHFVIETHGVGAEGQRVLLRTTDYRRVLDGLPQAPRP